MAAGPSSPVRVGRGGARARAVLAWAFAAVVIASGARDVSRVVRSDGTWASLVGGGVWLLVPVAFVVLGAFVVTRRPDNLIGWLLLVPGLAAANASEGLVTAPVGHPGWTTILAVYYDELSWIFLILPIFLVVALFPTGRPVSPRWRWHTGLVLLLAGVMVVLAVFTAEISPLDGAWTVHNPIGFLPVVAAVPWFFPLWDALLIVAVVGAGAAMTTRFRRAEWFERQQIKTVLYAVGVFVVIYAVSAANEGWGDNGLVAGLLGVGLLLVPSAIALAILRHRVFDIDLVIRRTVVYAIVTGLLAGVFVGSVVLFQAAAQRISGLDSSVGVAASTLLIAGLFNPLRSRTQDVLDRRFFRSRYDAVRTLDGFAGRVRSQVDVDRLSEELVGAVTTALRPGTATVWLRR